MRYRVYAVRDSAVEAFLMPLFFRSQGEALRSFSDAVNSGEHGFHAHPEHYSLWFLGEYDDDRGLMLPVDLPVAVINGVDLLAMSQGGPSDSPGARPS